MSKVVLNTRAVYIAMINAGLTKTALCHRMEVDWKTLDNYLKNPDKIQLQAVTRMAAALGVPYVMDLIEEVPVA